MVTPLLSSAVNPGNEDPANWDALSVGSEKGPMAAPDAIAERLHRLYVDELLQSLMPPVHRMVHERPTQALIRRAGTAARACAKRWMQTPGSGLICTWGTRRR